MDDDARAVFDAIGAAFAGVARGEITLHEAEAIDSYGTPAERARARLLDIDTSWDEISDADVEGCPNSLPHLDPASWAYYLPRFMRWSLQHLRSSRASMVVDHTIYALLLGDDRSLNDSLRARFARLSAEQASAVRGFLGYMARHDDRCDAHAASDALRRRWAVEGT